MEYHNETELYHWGVKGMKWGVRRYQNKDGSLTSKGKKRYSRMSDDELRKEIYNQVKKERSKQTGWYNKWDVSNTIGSNSKAAQDKYLKDKKEYESSDSFKQAVKKLKTLDKRFNEGKIDPDKYNAEYEKINKEIYKPELDRSVTIGNKSRKYANEYLNKYGKELNIGYLKDLGYDDRTSREFAERIMKANKKLLNGM